MNDMVPAIKTELGLKLYSKNLLTIFLSKGGSVEIHETPGASWLYKISPDGVVPKTLLDDGLGKIILILGVVMLSEEISSLYITSPDDVIPKTLLDDIVYVDLLY